MMDTSVIEFAGLVKRSFDAQTLKTVTFSSPVSGDAEKVRLEIRKMGGGNVLQGEYRLTEGRVTQRNLTVDEIESFVCNTFDNFKRAELYDAGGSASLMKSKKGKISIVRHGTVGKGDTVKLKENNREKQYILSGNEEFLRHLGISDGSGRVYDKKQSKFRQINRFLENLRDVLKYLPKSGEIRVADLCCGKSYLSFAVYYYLNVCLERSVSMFCMDLKESVMDYCREVARKCNFDGMTFEAGDINLYDPEKSPHLVVSLHACDIATDIVLDKSIVLGADVILSTPCCHRDLSRKLECDELDFVARHSILKSKMCDALTDSLRILRLEACGYNCTAIELIDPDDTPKNVLIRAIRRKNVDYKGTVCLDAHEKYKAAYKFLCSKEAPDLPVKKHG